MAQRTIHVCDAHNDREAGVREFTFWIQGIEYKADLCIEECATNLLKALTPIMERIRPVRAGRKPDQARREPADISALPVPPGYYWVETHNSAQANGLGRDHLTKDGETSICNKMSNPTGDLSSGRAQKCAFCLNALRKYAAQRAAEITTMGNHNDPEPEPGHSVELGAESESVSAEASPE